MCVECLLLCVVCSCDVYWVSCGVSYVVSRYCVESEPNTVWKLFITLFSHVSFLTYNCGGEGA